MVKAMAIAQGWEYERHSNFSQVLNLAYLATNDDRIWSTWGGAYRGRPGDRRRPPAPAALVDVAS